MGILEGKNILVAGVTMNTSIGYKIADLAQREGANVVVSNFGRAMGITARVIKKLDPVPPLIELDVTNDEDLAGLADALREHFDHLDGVVHSIAFANPETALGGNFLKTSWPDVGQAVHISAYSLVALTMACRPLLRRGSSIVGLTFDASVSWPFYDWMGVAKAALESANRYLSRYLGPEGIRSNLISAGPIDTLAKKAIPGTSEYNRVWGERAPLGWDPADSSPAAKGVLTLLSDFFPATTGEIIHVDGGLHATGS